MRLPSAAPSPARRPLAAWRRWRWAVVATSLSSAGAATASAAAATAAFAPTFAPPDAFAPPALPLRLRATRLPSAGESGEVVGGIDPRRRRFRDVRRSGARSAERLPLLSAAAPSEAATFGGGDDDRDRDDGLLLHPPTPPGSAATATPEADDPFRLARAFDAVVNARYACTRFRRFREPPPPPPPRDGNDDDDCVGEEPAAPTASRSDPAVISSCLRALDVSRRSPTGFNVQPWRVVLVHSAKEKERLARHCLGRNADRVRDSDCAAVFLADRECGREWGRFASLSEERAGSDAGGGASKGGGGAGRATRKLRALILLFSSGYPLPRILRVPLSFAVRTAVSILSSVARWLDAARRSVRALRRRTPRGVPRLPTLSSSEVWSEKNAILAASTYLLACASRGVATCPMEGYDARGVKGCLGAPKGRWGVPLIVCAGTPYRAVGGGGGAKLEDAEEEEETDDVGMRHGAEDASPRYPLEEVAYGDAFGGALPAT
ncbi:hypothetical protein ACHAWF_002382 [Thalassiosira exigua]